jgi:hypothetical protein
MYEESPFLYAAAAAATLLAEHATLRDRLTRPQAYVLGTATIGAAFGAWCYRNGHAEAFAAWATITGLGGGAILTAWWVRGELAAIDIEAFESGVIAGRAGWH